ncbi:MAG TPA: DUF1802 family protein, partial [Chthoniobacterales bacterium]|nr:DUF1802 family protein [Chthoniobacterales bacterium]
MGSVGFKEWALVCEALGRGEQTIILRKGGIAEGREGFSFKHGEFFLFPTFFHEQVDKIRGGQREVPMRTDGETQIRFFAQVELAATIRSWEIAEALEPFHILRPDVVRERFEYDRAPGIHVAFLRVFRLGLAWNFPDARQYGGCRSWVQLPDVPPAHVGLEPALSESDHAAR